MGGGSASLTPHYRISPLDGLRANLEGVDVRFEPGCIVSQSTPPLTDRLCRTRDGEPGIELELFAGAGLGGVPVERSVVATTRLLYIDEPPPAVPDGAYAFRATAVMTPTETGTHTFTLLQAGTARLMIDGEVVIDGAGAPARLLGFSDELEARVDLTRGAPATVVIEYTSSSRAASRGVRVGCRVPIPTDLMDRAVDAAAASDAAVVVVGADRRWESEGQDRDTMALPGAQHELITRVARANPNTVVVVNTGVPIDMSWADTAPAVVQAWFGGQEMGNGLSDVLTGAVDASGRPTTFPLAVEHNPSYGNFPGENSEVRYGEGLLVGYRWYDARGLPVRFPFGHGLSYTTFAWGTPRVTPASATVAGVAITVEVPVTNTGGRRGAEVVQCYVEPRRSGLSRPRRELKAFAKVWLDPGETTVVSLALAERAFAYWEPGDPEWPALAEQLQRFVPSGQAGGTERGTRGWRVDPGAYDLCLARSATDIVAVVPVTLTA
jgi:beta-glucosidase